MLNALKNESNRTFTENGAATLQTSGSACLDLFATIGALRNAEDQNVVRRFVRAWAENPDVAMKMLFYGRDVRGGLGERKVFRVILRWLASAHKDTVIKNIGFISEYGRWDDVMVLMGTPCENDAVALIRQQLDADLSAEDQVYVSIGQLPYKGLPFSLSIYPR